MDARVFLAVHSLSLCAENIEDPGPRTRAVSSRWAVWEGALSYPNSLTGVAHLSE